MSSSCLSTFVACHWLGVIGPHALDICGEGNMAFEGGGWNVWWVAEVLCVMIPGSSSLLCCLHRKFSLVFGTWSFGFVWVEHCFKWLFPFGLRSLSDPCVPPGVVPGDLRFGRGPTHHHLEQRKRFLTLELRSCDPERPHCLGVSFGTYWWISDSTIHGSLMTGNPSSYLVDPYSIFCRSGRSLAILAWKKKIFKLLGLVTPWDMENSGR